MPLLEILYSNSGGIVAVGDGGGQLDDGGLSRCCDRFRYNVVCPLCGMVAAPRAAVRLRKRARGTNT